MGAKSIAKFKYKIERIVKWSLAPVSALLIGVLKVLSPFIKVKFCPINYPRIGHLAGNTEIFLRRLHAGRLAKGFKYIGVSGKSCNRQFMKMIKRQMLVIENRLFSGVIKSALFQRSLFFEDMPYNSNEYQEYNNLPRVINFTKEEEERGTQELKKMGIGPGDWFVCFHNRDSVYLDKLYEFKDWNYHNYRDCHISNFVPAMEYIASLGGYAIRMGQYMSEKLEINNNLRIIDYASNFRSDFMDIYLPSHCKFFVGNTAGLHAVSVVAGVPIIMTNTVPWELPGYRYGDLFLLKKIRKKIDGSYLTFGEVFDKGISGWWFAYMYEEAGLDLIENGSEEITAVVKEMNLVLDGKYQYNIEDNRLQASYWSHVKSHHGCYGCPARIGKDFLAANRQLLGGK